MHASDSPPTASCHEVWLSYSKRGAPPTHALQGVSAAVFPGELVSVVGPSGSGKSSLLHVLAGFACASQGQSVLLGQDITRAGQSAIARLHRRGVGVIFQSLNLVPSLPVLVNVLLPSRFAHRPVDQARARDLLAHLGLGDRVSHRTSALSGGEQQRVAVARAMYAPPTVLFADEPTGALDSHSGALVLERLRDLARAGSTVVLVTHDLGAASLADRALVMRDGQIVGEVMQPSADQLMHFGAGGQVGAS